MHFFAIFENGHYDADQEYFCESNSTKIRELDRTRQSYHLKIITGTLKMIVFLKIFKYRTSVPSNYFKEQSSKRKFEEKNSGGVGALKWANWVLTWSKENKTFIYFLFIFSF